MILSRLSNRQCSLMFNPIRTLTAQSTNTVSDQSSPKWIPKKSPPKAKGEGSIENVFATLSGGSLQDSLPKRFKEVKQSIIQSDQQARAIQEAFVEIIESLEKEVQEIELKGETLIPQIEYPGNEIIENQSLEQWMGKETIEKIKKRGSIIIKNVVSEQKALQWKQSIRDYIQQNPQTKGFPSNDPQVFELYWSKAQLEARGNRSLLNVSRSILNLFHTPAQTGSREVEAASLQNVLSYCDRLRIRMPGDATFALGPHIDGGGVERWEDLAFRQVWNSILQPNEKGKIDWKSHDSFSLGENSQRLLAQTSLYDGAGACSVFRPFQGWLSLSHSGKDQGTLKVLPLLKQVSAYIILKPFFRPIKSKDQCSSESEFLHSQNWKFDLSDENFDGCVALGRNIELDSQTHPHLKLDQTMKSIPKVSPGDCTFWHCDQVHAVESKHNGKEGQDSSVLYIPAIPLTRQNFEYISYQNQSFQSGIPPPDFPGGQGESNHIGRGKPDQIEYITARRAMGLEPFELRSDMSLAERQLIQDCNAQLNSSA